MKIYAYEVRDVVMTQHMAFYTDEAVESMVRCGLGGIVTMHETGTCPTEIMLR